MAYDAIVIGAGMSGLATAIRLGMFEKKVLLLEKHSIPGGLNSYYQRRNFDKGGVRQFDVGLHALTNFIKKGEKGKPFSKLLKQLRLSYDDFRLCPQSFSQIHFPDAILNFSNEFSLLESEVQRAFPEEIDNFRKLTQHVRDFNELDLNLEYSSSREVLKTFIKNPLLIEMILCPLLIYGSAWEEDMDFAQFVVMFKSIYFEGFSRPEGGVRTILSLLMKKLDELGVEIRFRTAVSKIVTTPSGEVCGVEAGGEFIESKQVFSSMGLPETMNIAQEQGLHLPPVGKMTFLESILVFDRKFSASEQSSTIVFYNDSDRYQYRRAPDYFDPGSAVVCFPDNYEPQLQDGEGTARVTFIANYDQWRELERSSYDEKKESVAKEALGLVRKLSPGFEGKLLFKDVFSPTTIERYTWHLGGTVYGSTDKVRDGKTKYKNLFIIGTDQGFLGIVGSLLSGISMANLHGLMESE